MARLQQVKLGVGQITLVRTVAVVKDATAGPRHPGWGDGYPAAMINYRFLAHAVLSTEEAIEALLPRGATSTPARGQPG